MERVKGTAEKSTQSVFQWRFHSHAICREAIMTKSRVFSDVVMKTAYMSFAAASLVFVLMLLLTGLHP
jgi:hypothetical protein